MTVPTDRHESVDPGLERYLRDTFARDAGGAPLPDDLAGEARRRGVDIHLGTEATAERVEMLAPDAVVVATGAVPQRPWWAPPADGGGERICDVVDVLTGAASPTGSVVVIDDIGFHHATSVADVWAGGDCVGGKLDLTVQAVEDGKRAAHAIDHALSARRA